MTSTRNSTASAVAAALAPDALVTVRADAGDAAPGTLPDSTCPALIEVRAAGLGGGIPAVVITFTRTDSAVLLMTCEDAGALGQRLRDLARNGRGRHRTVPVQALGDARSRITRISIGRAVGRPVLTAGATYVLGDDDARVLAAALLAVGTWAPMAHLMSS